MRTGFDAAATPGVDNHTQSFITAATTVFMHDLCNYMIRYQMLTGTEDVREVARCCALYHLQSTRCKDLERMVEQVIEHPDGMPQLPVSHTLRDVMFAYENAAPAIRAGNAAQYRREQVVPAIVESAMQQDIADDDEDALFVQHIGEWSSQWQQFEPSTPFEQIVFRAINTMPL